LIISGDIANRATDDEYRAAFSMIDGLVKRFGLDPGRVVVVPGNHDVNWSSSKKAYPFVYKEDLPPSLPAATCIPAGELGALRRDDVLYAERFSVFSTHFYRRVYGGREYPTDYSEQIELVERPEDQLLILGLNSCWELDHHFTDRSSINMRALTKALDRLNSSVYDSWFKLAVWHHPTNGAAGMGCDFLELLATSGFKVCLSGHIHEAKNESFLYDYERRLHLIGAGTFGARPNDQVPGISLQYNLLDLSPSTGTLKVQTRKKQKADGAWSADARWGDKQSSALLRNSASRCQKC
jgi:predicted phosphohydrolase